MFKNKFFVSFVLVLAFLFLFSLSSVSADEYYFNSSNITNESFQGVIDNSTPDEVIINLDDGEYSLGQINITRNATIVGNSSGNVKINGSGILFNITSSNVKLINLTITGYTNAIISNSSDLTVTGNNITTSGISINISSSGGNLSNIVIEDNFIVSSVSNSNYGAVFVNGNGMAISFVSFINNSIRGNGTINSISVRINSKGLRNLTFDGNNITGTSRGVYLDAYSSNNTNITFANNNITGGEYGVYVRSYGGNVSGVMFLNNTINATGGSGFYFVNDGSGAINVTDFIIRGNNIFAGNVGLNFSGLKSDSLVNVTVEYNRILSPVGVNITDFNDNSSFNYNWWGVNDITGKTLGIDTLNHFILNVSNLTSLDNLRFGDNVSFAFLVLNTSLVNDGVEYLPYFMVNGTYNNQTFVVDNFSNFTGVWNVSGGDNVFAVTLDSQDVGFTFSAGKLDSNSTIIVNPSIVHVGENVTVSGQLANFTGIGSVNVTVDGDTQLVNINSSGGWSLNYASIRTGNITLTVSFNGNDNYTAFTNGTSFEVLKNSTNSSIVVLSGVHVGDIAVITGVLANFTGISSVNVTVDGNLYENVIVDSVGGNWTVSHLTNHTGTYTVIVEYTELETGNFTGFINSTSFDVLKNSTNSTIDVSGDFKVGENISISGILADVNSDPIDNAQMTIIIGNESFNVTTNISGVWSLVYTLIHGGEFFILVNWAGNDNYTGFINSTSFDVSKLDSNSSIVIPVDIKVNETVLISGVLTDENNNTISGANLEVIIDGETFNVTTDSVGVWSLNYTPEHSGVFNLSLFYQGDSRYDGFVENKAFNVSKLATTSSINIPSNVKVGKPFTVSGVLTSDGKPLANTIISVIVDGKTYKVTTNSLGVWKLSYTPKKTGKSTMKVSFAGNNDYLGFNVSKTFNVTGKVKISIVKISKLVKVGKYRGFNLYSKVYTIKNVGSALGSKDYVKYFKNWYLEKLSKTSKIIKYQFSVKSRVLKVQIKNLGVGKQVKIKILVTHRKRL
ncbi:beta strand repeat-containing protein [Methanobrevibacter arboriphilus]|uniref:Uncharacterized protein n=1 Tax=Methanobrevibacter arboriphilus TaxID=39441 RepID=A0ACA8R113_METAZ|nr:hypothetical protein [Methanobrevibacter arboriphilus]BBL61034.1 hypothetical protein MarbSA_00740 [Methanobrevibacter arboriphilus]